MITTWPENRFGTHIEYPTFAGDVVSGAGMTWFSGFPAEPATDADPWRE
jgi:hypothetical protein